MAIGFRPSTRLISTRLVLSAAVFFALSLWANHSTNDTSETAQSLMPDSEAQLTFSAQSIDPSLLSSSPPLNQGSISAERLTSAQLDAIRSYIEQAIEEKPNVGLAVGIDHHGETTTWYRGLANRETGLRVHERSLFRMASVSKMMTAVAVIRAAEVGKLDLKDRISEHTSLWPKASPVIVEDVLAHLSGISSYRDCRKECYFTRHRNTKQSIDIFKNWPLESQPRERYIYTSYGYNLLAAMLESIEGQRFQSILEERIFSPLGMQDTFIEFERQRNANWVQGYRFAGKIKKSKYVDISSRFGGGGTRSTLPDMLKFGRGLLDKQLIHDAYLPYVFDTQFTRNGVRTDYGLGFATFPYAGNWVVGHAGGQPETSTLLLVVPQHDLVIALASNLEGDAQKLKAISRRIIEIVSNGGQYYWPITGHTPKLWLKAQVYQRLTSYGPAYDGLSKWLSQDKHYVEGKYPKKSSDIDPIHPCHAAEPILKALQVSSPDPRHHRNALQKTIGQKGAVVVCGHQGHYFGLEKLAPKDDLSTFDPRFGSCSELLDRLTQDDTSFRYDVAHVCIEEAAELFKINSESAVELLIRAMAYNPMSYKILREVVFLRFLDAQPDSIQQGELDFFKKRLLATPERPDAYTIQEVNRYKYKFSKRKKNRFKALEAFFAGLDAEELHSDDFEPAEDVPIDHE